MKNADIFHIPVMRDEALAALRCRSGGIYIDGTAGGGGHAFKILEDSSPDGRLVAMDADKEAIKETAKRLEHFGSRAVVVHENFSSMRNVLTSLGINKVDGILLDLGVSSHQLDSAVRGFSFTLDAPLDMRMNSSLTESACDLVNTLPQEELEIIIRKYGEEKMARRIAAAITRKREITRICTTKELAGIVAGAFPEERRHGRIHPATRTFQAIRIAVNDELANLQKALEEGIDILASEGRFCVISFHSLEDRIVKNSFSENEKGCICPPDLPLCVCGRKPRLRIVTKKPLVPREAEIHENPRARSAKLRVAEKI